MKTPAHKDTAQQGAGPSHEADENLAQLLVAVDEIDREFGISARRQPPGELAQAAGDQPQPNDPNQT